MSNNTDEASLRTMLEAFHASCNNKQSKEAEKILDDAKRLLEAGYGRSEVKQPESDGDSRSSRPESGGDSRSS